VKVHVWCPGVCGPGGIEAYSKEVVHGLAQIFPRANITVFARNDRSSALRQWLPAAVVGIGLGEIPNLMRAQAFATLVFSGAVIDRPDLIFSTHLNFAPVARWLKRLQKTRYWISLHGIEVWQMTNRSRSRAVFEADLLLPVSRYTRNRVAAEQEIPESKFQILPDTFDVDRFTPGQKSHALFQRYHLAENTPIILTVGRLTASERYKGHDRILRALPHVRNAVAGVRYLIVGDGDDRPRLEQLSRELRLSDSVIFCGEVSSDELADYYRLCDVFVMPSTGEGFGIVFLEALACGKPVIAGNIDASPDALRDGELGILIDPNNTDALADAIVEILTGRSSHPLIYRPEELHRHVVERFGPEAFRSRLQSILRDKLNANF
jgi:phosphatidylinositol alpha-1,6-mannosyltransferase